MYTCLDTQHTIRRLVGLVYPPLKIHQGLCVLAPRIHTSQQILTLTTSYSVSLLTLDC